MHATIQPHSTKHLLSKIASDGSDNKKSYSGHFSIIACFECESVYAFGGGPPAKFCRWTSCQIFLRVTCRVSGLAYCYISRLGHRKNFARGGVKGGCLILERANYQILGMSHGHISGVLGNFQFCAAFWSVIRVTWSRWCRHPQPIGEFFVTSFWSQHRMAMLGFVAIGSYKAFAS